MSEQDILAALQGWFVEKTGTEADPASRYLETSGLDSFEVIELIGFIEANFPFRFQSGDFQKAEFFSLNGLSRMIAAGGNG
jgi:acyl carrier protein